MTATLDETEMEPAEDTMFHNDGPLNLAKKYRPMLFGEVQGQPEVQGLANMIEKQGQESVSPTYLFSGTRGSGKTTTARILARAVNCTDIQPGGEPCNKCESCTHMIDFSWGDAIYEADAASNRGVNDIKEIVQRTTLATRAKKRVVILDEAHSLTREAQESLLKTLEEPSDSVIWVLCTTDPHKLVATIVSRCTQITMRDLSEPVLTRVLENINDKEGLDLPPDIIGKAAYRGHGSARDAITAMQSLMLHDSDNSIQNFKMLDNAIASKSESEFIRSSDYVFSNESSFQSSSYVQHLIEILRAAMIIQIDESRIDERHEYFEQIDLFANEFGTQKIIRALQHFSSQINQISTPGVNHRVVMEAAVVSFLVPAAGGSLREVLNLLDDLVEQVADLQSTVNELRNSKPIEKVSELSPWVDEKEDSKDSLVDDLSDPAPVESTDEDDQPEAEAKTEIETDSEEDSETEDAEKLDEGGDSEDEDKKKSRKAKEPEPEPEDSEDEESGDEEDSKFKGTKDNDDDILDAYYDDALALKIIGARARKALDVHEKNVIIERNNKIATKIIVKTDALVGKPARNALSDFFLNEYGMEFDIEEED